MHAPPTPAAPPTFEETRSEMQAPRYLSRALVERLMPDAEAQRALVARAFRAMAAGNLQLPPKPTLALPGTGFLHAMPVYLEDDGIAAVKWIGGSPGNRLRGLPYLTGILVLNDPETAMPLAVMDAAEITAERTAAVSLLCIDRFAPDGWKTVGIVGFGKQGRTHAARLRELHPHARILVHGRSPVEDQHVVSLATAREVAEAADVLITAIPLDAGGPVVESGWLRDRCLVLPLDFDAAIGAELVQAADALVVDNAGQFAYYAERGHFAGWPEPDLELGATIETTAAGEARVVCCNLGVGSMDAVYADAIFAAAQAQGAGDVLD
jgi:ornithine cyclodeaminase/alanine dehydrogenase-like protein (mu-crystallin family)